jgi:CRP-like cAMP-binding protein
VAIFSEVQQDTLIGLLDVTETKELVRGDVLFAEGDQPSSLHIVLSGRIAIVMTSDVDSRESVVALMDSGDLFGELGLLDNGARSATARAIEPTSVLEIGYEHVKKIFDAQPDLVWAAARMLAQRLRTMDEALSDSVFLDVTGRTAKRIIELSEGNDEFTMPVTQEELAGMVGASRERVNKAIASFVKLGWLEQHDRNYRILQRTDLEIRAH